MDDTKTKGSMVEELLPSSSPWHKQAGCPCSSYGRKHYSLERKRLGECSTVEDVGVSRVCGKVGARKSDGFSELARKTPPAH